MDEKNFRITKKSLDFPLTFLAIFVGIGIWRYLSTGGIFFVFIFSYIGFSVALGSFLSRSLASKYKPLGRKITLLLIGLFILGFLGLIAHENMQMEGFFFYLFAGVFSGAFLHYFIAKLVGPLFFGRGWCGWGCWTVMFLDFFPWKKPAQGRIPYLGLLRYLHFAISFLLIFALFYILGYGFKEHRIAELEWLIIGNVIYYFLAILLAVILKDNRAFCKYVCPIPATMKPLSRFSLYKQKVDFDNCDECELCETNCPMDIKLLAYARIDQRILSTECILCDTCVHTCPTDAISTTKGFDAGWIEHINFR